MKSKIRVHGKSQSRTALGIINAYLKLHPDATPSEVQKAFPKSLNSRCSADNLIVPVRETVGHEKLFFERSDEQVVFKNGETYSLVEVWGKKDFAAICKHAKRYGIKAAKEGTKPFERGSFELEDLDDVKGSKWWWLGIFFMVLLLLLIILYCKVCGPCSERSNPDLVVTQNAETEQSGDDLANSYISENSTSTSITLPDGKVLTMLKSSQEFKLFSFLNSSETKVEAGPQGWINLDKVHFATGKANLNSGSEAQLKNIAMIMQFFPNCQFKIGGYADNTGTDTINMRLSSERAKVATEKLLSLGVAANRLAHEGYSSQNPVCALNDSEDCRAANRRAEIKVTHK